MVMRRGLLFLLTYLGSQWAILFLAAGTLDWLMGWSALGAYSLISLATFFLVDRELVKERLRMGAGADRRDVVLATASYLFFQPITLLVAGLDRVRFSWSPPFPEGVLGLALAGYLAGNGLASWAMTCNPFFSVFLRIQRDRGHRVAQGGPYHWIRHPGYAGTVLAAVALPLALGSLWATLPALLGAGGFVVRTAYEDRVMKAEMKGYPAYARRVRFRLLPWIW
jgi:protein-S-isoprenylcysteine O-methyltransferase Ste14